MWSGKSCLSLIIAFIGCAVVLYSCGYRFIGSSTIPFNSITIDPIVNKTYEPRLEEILHRALSDEFIAQGIQVMAQGGDYRLKSTITEYRVAPVAEFDKSVKEHRITMLVDFVLSKGEKIIEFKRVSSPYKFTFQTTDVTSDVNVKQLNNDELERIEIRDTVIRKEIDTIRVSREIALELIVRIIAQYS
jgi:hypothetical protein